MKRCIQLVCLLLVLAGAAAAQMKMSVERLVTFVTSSVQMKEDDRKVAEIVKKIQLLNQLDAKTIESLQELGAGRLTVAALKALRTDSASLPAAPAPPPKLTAAPIPGPSEEDQKKVLAAITENAIHYSEGLPNFICMQVTRRYVAQSGSDNFRLTDTIAERLSYNEHHEDYKVISVNGTPVANRKHEQLGGAMSSGVVRSCPGGNGIHISANGGTLSDSASGVNTVIGLGQSVDTTLVFDIAQKTWTRTNLEAAITVGFADESRGRYMVCAGVSALLPNVTLTVQGAKGRVHFAASLKEFNDALRLGPGR